MESSCIIKHFEHYSPLSDSDKTLLNSLEKSPKTYRKNTTIWQQGSPSEDFYTVSQGWAYSYRNMEDGTRQVLDIYVPGDIVGLREFAFEKRITGLVVLSDAELCAFPKARLMDVFSESLLLCSIFFMVASADQALLLERLINFGRRSARQKLAHLLLEVSKRLKKANHDSLNPLKLPLSQTLLADALGLSVVHVNRVFRELRDDKLISSTTGAVELLDIEGLSKVACFETDYLEENADIMLQHARDMQSRFNGSGKSTLTHLDVTRPMK